MVLVRGRIAQLVGDNWGDGQGNIRRAGLGKRRINSRAWWCRWCCGSFELPEEVVQSWNLRYAELSENSEQGWQRQRWKCRTSPSRSSRVRHGRMVFESNPNQLIPIQLNQEREIENTSHGKWAGIIHYCIWRWRLTWHTIVVFLDTPLWRCIGRYIQQGIWPDKKV